MLTLGQSVIVIMRGTVLWRHVRTLMIARELTDGFHAGGPAVDDLHEVEVATGLDGDAHPHSVAYGKTGSPVSDGLTR